MRKEIKPLYKIYKLLFIFVHGLSGICRNIAVISMAFYVV